VRPRPPRPSVLALAAVAAFGAFAVPVALAATAAANITATSIAGAKLGLGKVAYKKLLGAPVRFQAALGGDMGEGGFQQPSDYTRLVFTKRKMDVYFQGGVDHAIMITTWNRSYRSAEGVGPCSTLAQVKKAYGKRLKPNPGNTIGTSVFSYLVGRTLIFEFANTVAHPAVSKFVTSVALYDGTAPTWNQRGGTLGYASFVASAPDQVPCS
jgi:hypothetical protein